MRRATTVGIAALILGALSLSAAPTLAQPPGGALSKVRCSHGRAGPFPCDSVDLDAFVPMSDLGGGRASDIWGWTDLKTMREYALMGTTRGLAFVDVTKPAKPVYLGTMVKPETALIWQDVEVYKDHAYVVCDLSPCGMQIFDLTRLRGEKEPQSWVPDLVYTVTPTTHSIDINPATGFAYLNGSLTLANGSPHIVDITEPKRPVPAGFILDDGYTHDSHCRIYLGPDKPFQKKEICLNANEDTVTIYDVTNKLLPEQLARVTYENASYTHQAWFTTDHKYMLVSDEGDEDAHGINSTTYIFDIRKLAKPKLIGTYVAPYKAIDHNNYILGQLDYQASYTAGLRILDLKNVAKGKLREVGYFDVVPMNDDAAFDGAWATYPFLPSGNVLISGMGQGLFVVSPRLRN